MFLYSFLLFFYHQSIRLASFFNPKAKLWSIGRQNWRSTLKLKSSSLSSSPIWIHCASLGEFEQGKPVIIALKEKYPAIPIVLSFYSPSGYEIRKDYPLADIVTYLPVDTAINAKGFLDIIQPRLAVFVKYEFWLHYLNELTSRNIPKVLIAGSFRKEQIFFKSYGSIFKNALSSFQCLLVQTKEDVQLLRSIDIASIDAGDPRLDNVLSIAKHPKDLPLIEKFANNQKVLILGSSWQAEEKVIFEWLKKRKDKRDKIILAPHDISPKHLENIKEACPVPLQTYSDIDTKGLKSDTQVVLINNIGLLSSIYQYGYAAFIGGGFGNGIHNILEATAYHIPVFFGKNYRKFPEAKMLVKKGGAFVVHNSDEVDDLLEKLNNKSFYTTISSINKQYMSANQGATDKIVHRIEKYI